MAKRMYYGGTVLTMEDILYAQALLVEDGVIRAVGSEAEVRAAAGRDCEMVDLKGHTLMPAFIDAHSHFSGCANALLQVPLGEAVSFDEIEERIAAFIRDNHISKGQWVAAQGFDHNVLREKRPPRREVLDRAAPDNPVIMAHQSGHTGVLNTLALERLGITPDTPVPEGGMMEVADGKVTGYMEETAFLNCQSRVPMPAPEDLMGAYLRAGRLCAAWRHHGAGRDDDTGDGTAVQAAVRGGPAEAGRGGISGYHTGGRHANGAVRTHRTVQRPF